MLRHVPSAFGKLLVKARSKETVLVRMLLSSDQCLRQSNSSSTEATLIAKVSKGSGAAELLGSPSNQAVLEDRIRTLDTVEDVLDAAVSWNLKPRSVHLVIRRLLQLQLSSSSERYVLESDARFHQMTCLLEEGVTDLSPFSLIDSLYCLLQLTKEDISVIRSLEMQLRSVLKRLTFGQLLRVAQIHKTCDGTILRQSMLDEAMNGLEERRAEIASPRELVTMLYLVDDSNKKLLSELEEKALELSEAMNIKDIYRIICLMAKRNRRNVPVIRSLIYHLNKFALNSSGSSSGSSSGLDPVHVSNLLYACVRLNVSDSRLFSDVAQRAVSGGFTVESDLSALLRSFGLLRWYDKELLDSVAPMLLANNTSNVAPDALASLLLTSASVNYLSPSVTEILSKSMTEAEKIHVMDPRTWLDIVWSAVVLSVATPQMLSSVLNSDFFLSIKGACASQHPVAVQLKLMNINAVAKHCMPNYSGPYLSESLQEEFLKQIPVQQHSLFRDCLLDTLANMANLDKYVRKNVKTSAGFIIDAEIIVNSSVELQQISELHNNVDGFRVPSYESSKSHHRIAVQLLEFGDMTQGKSIHPTGLCALCSRILTEFGYKVIQIPYNEFNMKMTIVQRVEYLNNRMKQSLGLTVTDQQPSAEQTTVATAATTSLQQQTSDTKERAAGHHQHQKPSPSSASDPPTSLKGNKLSKGFIKLNMKDILDDPVTSAEDSSRSAQHSNSTSSSFPKI